VIVSVSLVLLLGVLILLLIRYAKLRAWQALLCVLFGYYVASTPIGQYLNSAVTAVVRLISGIQL
jgi:uncharacterized SAM-binding protein YcdF (DUF218 family)